MSVRLHIEHLVVEGIDVPHGARRAFRAALERELTQRIAAGGIGDELSSGGAVPSVAAPAIDLASGTDAPRLGAAIAGSVFAGLGGKP